MNSLDLTDPDPDLVFLTPEPALVPGSFICILKTWSFVSQPYPSF